MSIPQFSHILVPFYHIRRDLLFLHEFDHVVISGKSINALHSDLYVNVDGDVFDNSQKQQLIEGHPFISTFPIARWMFIYRNENKIVKAANKDGNVGPLTP